MDKPSFAPYCSRTAGEKVSGNSAEGVFSGQNGRAGGFSP